MSLHPFAAEAVVSNASLTQAATLRLQAAPSLFILRPTHPTYCIILRWLRVGRLDCPECKLGVRSRRAFARDERVDCLVTELLTSFSADPADLTEEQVGGHSP